MRGWVGVGEEVTTKMAESPYIQSLEIISISKPFAHLTWTSFQPFASSQITTPRVIIFMFAQ
ncbi:hypothetical protein ANSO36C_61310 [Nostoc cf. commune SO-36]|uniref:Uncharacterized protein n=1 Tax=Nostoc cf. commune SO-36 TaxID=449208 RepID=A0ABM7ZAQ1_NOSCO|nr:hypothetical protein ANSO36C_61310 [Nostoc cf. commune SO-36]